MATFQFWYDFASTYSFLTSQRIERQAAEHDVAIEWKPFMLGVILRERGWEGNPAEAFPVKGRYMWRDIKRRAARLGLEFKRPSTFPRNPVLANRVAQIAADEGWCGEFTRRAFAANFSEDREIGERDVVADLISACEQDPQAVLERAEAPANKERLKANTLDALTRGLFGAPSFTVDGELFWGDDRLEDALAWYRGERI